MNMSMAQSSFQQQTRDSRIFGDAIAKIGIQRYSNLNKARINTIDDMVSLWYPDVIGNDELINEALTKVDAPALSSTTGFYVANHGYNAFEQMINEANLTGLLAKRPYTFGGFRALTAAGSTSGEGQSENATLPDSTKPTAANIDVPIKEIAKTYDMSARQVFLSSSNYNDVWNQPGGNGMDALREYEGREFVKNINRALTTDNDILAGDNVESIDRVIGSFSEINGVGQTAGDLDIYGQDRDGGASWADAYVNHASGVDRALTSDLILDVLQNCARYWDGVNFQGDGNYSGVQNKFWLTGWDTAMEIAKIFENSNRYQNSGVEVRPSLNGIQTFPVGSQAGMLVNTLYGIPMFVTDDTPQDTISRLYLIDGDYMHLEVGIPPLNEEAGFSTGTSILLDRLGDRGLYYAAMELKAERFAGHGKLRDLL